MDLKSGSKIFLDTSPIIYFIEENSSFSSFPATIFEKMECGEVDVFTSTLTLVEVLTMPYKMGRNDIANIYKDFFYNSKGFTLANINPDISDIAAQIRAEFGFKTPDAVQLATFKFLDCDLFITNDIQLKKYDDSKVIVLAELSKS